MLNARQLVDELLDQTPEHLALPECLKAEQDILVGNERLQETLNSSSARYYWGVSAKDVAEDLEESKGPGIKTLKDNRTELEPAERRKVMAAGAVWHQGPGGKETPAVWKSVVKGKTWYCCNTHRCYQARRNLAAAINSFKFVKTTA